MGKFQSKIASKRRQSPEGNVVNTTHGGSLACNAQTCQKELKHIHKRKLTENLCVELRENRLDQNCNFSVLPPRNTDKSIYIQINKLIKKKQKGHAGSQQDTACMLVPNEDSQQQWVFTLYDSRGKVTKEDMFSLIQSMYEVIEASLTQPGHTPLRVRLAVIPTASSDTSTTADRKAENPERKLYCVDENIERRNHYLDLAGIENYASKFDSAESPSHEPTQKAPAAVQHRIVAERGNCRFNEPPRGASVPHSLKTKSPSARNDRNREGKPNKHPASWCHMSPSHPPTQGVLHRSHSRRLHCRVPDAGGDREILSSRPPCCGVPLVQKHEHHHHHDHHHHHHHHHHHYPPS